MNFTPSLLLTLVMASGFSYAEVIKNPTIDLKNAQGESLGKGRVSCDENADEVCRLIDSSYTSGQVVDCKEIKFDRTKYSIITAAASSANLAGAILTYPLFMLSDGWLGVCDDRLLSANDQRQCMDSGYPGTSQKLRLQVYKKNSKDSWDQPQTSIYVHDGKINVMNKIECN